MRSARARLAAAFAAIAVVGSTSAPVQGAEARLAPVKIELPRPEFIGTRKDFVPTKHQEPPPREGQKPRPPFLAPEGTANVALNKPVTGSDDQPFIGDLAQVTDGDKGGRDGSFVELAPGRQWVQIDLKAAYSIHAFLVWHYHGEGRYYHDVVVQVADDADFIDGVRTAYNSDYDNSSGLGIGKDLEYFETFEGRLISCKGVVARYVRLYSKGSTAGDMNHYVEVEVYGTPAK